VIKTTNLPNLPTTNAKGISSRRTDTVAPAGLPCLQSVPPCDVDGNTYEAEKEGSAPNNGDMRSLPASDSRARRYFDNSEAASVQCPSIGPDSPAGEKFLGGNDDGMSLSNKRVCPKCVVWFVKRALFSCLSKPSYSLCVPPLRFSGGYTRKGMAQNLWTFIPELVYQQQWPFEF
jgi:hypothetical protein